MTNLTRLRLTLVDLSGLMKKKTHLKQNVLFFKKLIHVILDQLNKMTNPISESLYVTVILHRNHGRCHSYRA